MESSWLEASMSVPFLAADWMALSRSLVAVLRREVSADSSLSHAERRRSYMSGRSFRFLKQILCQKMVFQTKKKMR